MEDTRDAANHKSITIQGYLHPLVFGTCPKVRIKSLNGLNN
jgi:hypothetical protein